MPRKMGLTRRHKRGTGNNKGISHERKIGNCHNLNGRSGTSAEFAPAPAEFNTDPILTQLSASEVQVAASTLLVAPSPPGTVMSYAFFKEVLLEVDAPKTITRSSNTITNTIPDEGTGTIVLQGTVLDTTTTTTLVLPPIPVVEQPLPLPPRARNFLLANTHTPQLNIQAFDQTASGKDRSDLASRKAKSRSTNHIVNAILGSSGTTQQQALALRSACLHPSILSITKTAGLLPVAREENLLLEGVKRTFKEVLGCGKRKRLNVDWSTFAEILSSSFASVDATHTQIAKVFDLEKQSCKRLFQKGEVRYLNAATAEAKWAEKVKLKGFSKITPVIKEGLDHWIRGHPNVQPSPITQDTLLVYNPVTGVKERTGKLLLEISVRELHNDMLLPENKGGFAGVRDADGCIIISDTTLRKLLPKELRPATETHKQLCGCELCNTAASLQKTLNAFWSQNLQQMEQSVNRAVLPRQRLSALRTYQGYRHSVASPDSQLNHLKACDAVTLMTCPNVTDTEFPPWKCVLGRCLACPKYQVPLFEADESNNAPRINFVMYERQSWCSFHGPCGLGKNECNYCMLENAVDLNADHEENSPVVRGKTPKIVVKKFPTLRCSKIGSFMRHVYLPILEKCRYHFAHKRMLSKMHCYNARHAWYESEPYLVKMHWDYAEPISQEKNLEIQSDHFGYVPSCSIEGVCVWSPLTNSVHEFNQGLIDKDQIVRTMQFHSHLSDRLKQDASTTHAHMICLLNKMAEKGEIQARKTTILEHSDGCSKQYRCGTALYLLSVLASQFGVMVDHMIGAPGHGKDVVDALNATTKKFLKEKMCMVSDVPGMDESERKMKAYSLSERENETTSFARECLRLCAVKERKDGVKSSGKYAKRERTAKISDRHYYLQDSNDVRLGNLWMTAVGLPTKEGTHSGLLARYNLRTDPDLGSVEQQLDGFPARVLPAANSCQKPGSQR